MVTLEKGFQMRLFNFIDIYRYTHTHTHMLVSQSCPTFWDPVDYSPPGSSVHGILRARMLEWVAIPFSRGISQPRDRTQVSSIVGRILNHLSHQGSPFNKHTLNYVTSREPGETESGRKHQLHWLSLALSSVVFRWLLFCPPASQITIERQYHSGGYTLLYICQNPCIIEHKEWTSM